MIGLILVVELVGAGCSDDRKQGGAVPAAGSGGRAGKVTFCTFELPENHRADFLAGHA
jgi:hypothetical protein